MKLTAQNFAQNYPVLLKICPYQKICMAIMTFTLIITGNAAYCEHPPFENSEEFLLMGDWTGQWINPQRGHEEHDPSLAAQLLPMGNNTYKVVLLPELFKRAEPYAIMTVPSTNGRLELAQDGWYATFENGEAHGEAQLHGDTVQFSLTQQKLLSPTLGKPAPENAVVLFDGTSFEHWQHRDGREVTWHITDEGAMEVVSLFWNSRENEANGLGGDIISRDGYQEFELHLEYRYAVEPEMRGQGRGNSGLIIPGIGELQILNSYTTIGYYDENGALYKAAPARVNASAPPLQWQTYDVTVRFHDDRDNVILLTAYLNGHRIHYDWEIETTTSDFNFVLQDHINRIQFRNIWVRPLNKD